MDDSPPIDGLRSWTTCYHVVVVRRLTSVLCLSASLVGCWTLTSNLGDIEGDHRDGAGTSSSSSSGGGSDAGTSDVDVSTSSSSSGGVVDSGDAAPSGFCASAGTHTACDDFSEGAPGDRWTVEQGNGGTATQVSSPVKSPPNAVRFTTPIGCATAYGQLTRKFTGGVLESAVVSFSTLVMSAPASADMYLLSFEWAADASGGKNYRIDVALREGKLEIYENAIGDEGFRIAQTSPVAFTKGVWHRIELQLDVDGARARVLVDGNGELDTALDRVKKPATASTTLEVGLYTGSGCDVVNEAIYDDVLVDLVTK